MYFDTYVTIWKVSHQTKHAHNYVVGLLVAIAREQSEACYLGYVFRTYGTEVPICSIGTWRETPGFNESHTFLVKRESVAREKHRKPVAGARSHMELDPHSFV